MLCQLADRLAEQKEVKMIFSGSCVCVCVCSVCATIWLLDTTDNILLYFIFYIIRYDENIHHPLHRIDRCGANLKSINASNAITYNAFHHLQPHHTMHNNCNSFLVGFNFLNHHSSLEKIYM